MWGKAKYVIIILLITNIATFYLYLNKPSNNNLILKMSGQSEHWNVTDYEIAYLSDYKWYEAGNAKFTFLGDADNVEKFMVKEYCKLLGGDSTIGGIGGDFNKNHMPSGSGGGSELPKYIKKNYLKEINENTYFVIEWTEYNGETKSERVDLKIDVNLRETKRFISE